MWVNFFENPDLVDCLHLRVKSGFALAHSLSKGDKSMPRTLLRIATGPSGDGSPSFLPRPEIRTGPRDWHLWRLSVNSRTEERTAMTIRFPSWRANYSSTSPQKQVLDPTGEIRGIGEWPFLCSRCEWKEGSRNKGALILSFL